MKTHTYQVVLEDESGNESVLGTYNSVPKAEEAIEGFEVDGFDGEKMMVRLIIKGRE